MNDSPAPQTKKTPEQRKTERDARLARFERMKIHGESRGWQVKGSGGMPVWQYVAGAKYQPQVSRK